VARRALVRGSFAATAALAMTAGLGPLAGPAAADAAPPVQTTGVYGISLAGGILNTVERTASGDGSIITGRQISPDGAAIGERTVKGAIFPWSVSVPCDAGACYPLYGTGDDRTAVLLNSQGKDRLWAWRNYNTAAEITTPSTGGRIVDVTGRFAVYNGGSPAKQYIDDFGSYYSTDVAQTRSVEAASVWGTRLWTGSATVGAVTATDLKQKGHRDRGHRSALRGRGAAGGRPLALLELRPRRQGGGIRPDDEEERHCALGNGAGRRRLSRTARPCGRKAAAHRLPLGHRRDHGPRGPVGR
jgi:hypothetical protein